MAREKFQTLTEQMFYILLCLREERCGVDVMEAAAKLTGGLVAIGPGTLYTLLEDFLREGWIRELPTEGRKRRYHLTPAGEARLRQEAERLRRLCGDFDAVMGQKEEETP